MKSNTEFLDVMEAATLLGLHPETVRRFAREQRIPGFKSGRAWRFRREELLAWTAEQEAKQQRVPRILAVDDDAGVREVVSLALTRAGFEVTAVAGAEEALACMDDRTPEAVVLDLRLQGMSGVTLLGKLRSLNPDLPVIIVTGYPESEMMQAALEYSPLVMLAKPVVPQQLVSCVRQAVAR